MQFVLALVLVAGGTGLIASAGAGVPLGRSDFAWTFEDTDFSKKHDRPLATSLRNGGNEQKLWVISEVGGRLAAYGTKFGEQSIAGLAHTEFDQSGLTNAYPELTVLFWFIKHGHTNAQAIVHRTSSGTATNVGVLVIEINSALQPSFGFADADRNPHRSMASFTIPGGEWSHLAMTFNKGAVTWYLNGNSKGTTKLAAKEIPGAQSRSRWTLSPQYSNNLDEFAIFSRVLTQSEIEEVVKKGLAAACGATASRAGAQIPKMPERPTIPPRPSSR